MTGVEFNENFNNNYKYISKPRGFSKFLIDKEIVKDQNTAEYLLIIVSIIFLGISIYLFTNLNDSPKQVEQRQMDINDEVI